MSKGYNTVIYKTNDYSIFKRLDGNREVTNRRVAVILKSIEEVGYISNPIIVNEKMEVIDGQGRLEACKQLDIPVEYRIVPGLGINECRHMNLRPTAWTVEDYCKSYAELGDKDYIRLVDIHNTYGLSYTVLATLVGSHSSLESGGNQTNSIKDGELVLDDKTFQMLLTFCDKFQALKKIMKQVGGRTQYFIQATWWVWKYTDDDFDRLVQTATDYSQLLGKFVTISDTLKNLSEVYNRGLKTKNRVYWDIEYKKGSWQERSEDLSIA